MKDLLIFPFGGNAREALITVLAQNNRTPTWNVIGFVDDDKKTWGKECFGFKVLGDKNILAQYPSAYILAAHGNPESFLRRPSVIEELNIPLDRYAKIIDPSTSIAPDAKIGNNTVIMSHAVVSCSVRIGNHCIILPNTVISHDTTIGDYSLIGSNVSISGSCSIGRNCYIGSGAKIKDHLNIGPRCLIGLGSCVIKDISDSTVAAGNPASPIGDNF